MNPSWSHDNKAIEEEVWVEDQLTWNNWSLASLVKREVRKGVVLQSEGRMENQEARRGLLAPFGLALGPTYKARPLNIKNRKSRPYTSIVLHKS